MQVLRLSPDQMEKRVARFRDLKPMADLVATSASLPPDLKRAAASQKVYSLTSPTGSSPANFWDAGAVPAGTPNFGAVYVPGRPGEGVGSHIHRYSFENFIALKGTWRILWYSDEKEEHIDLEPFDMISIPPGAMRRFECAGETEGLLLAFAYSEQYTLADARETVMAPPALEKLEAQFGAGARTIPSSWPGYGGTSTPSPAWRPTTIAGSCRASPR